MPFAHFTASLQSPGSQEAKPGEWVRAKRRAQLPLPGNGASSLLASFEPCAGLGGQIVAAHRWPASSLSAQPAEPSRSSLLGDSGQHSWPDFVLIVKGELVIGASGMDARTARATLSLRPLTGALQGPEDSPGSSGWPVAHLESRTKRLMPLMPFRRGRCDPRSLRSPAVRHGGLLRRASARGTLRLAVRELQRSSSMAPFTHPP